MRNQVHDDEFEHYLQKQVNQHKMFPSDDIWRNIRRELHGDKKWPALSAITVFIIAALVVGTLINKPQPDVVLSSDYKFSLPSAVSTNKKIGINNFNPSVFNERLAAEQMTKQTIAVAAENLKIRSAVTANKIAKVSLPIAANSSLIAENKIVKDSVAKENKNEENKYIISENEQYKQLVPLKETSFNSFKSRLRSAILNPLVNGNVTNVSSINNVQRNNSYDKEIILPENEIIQSTPFEKLKNTSSHFELRFYIAPSVSYRNLTQTENENAVSKTRNGAIPYESNYIVDPNRAIRHKPAIGYETGVALGYSLSDKLSVTAGVQFNISKYKVEAYVHGTEPASVTFRTGQSANRFNTLSSIRSIPGSTPITLTNRYYELSVPLGVDWKAWTNGRFTVGIAASLQPTYTFDKQPLIITSGFKNYTDGSSFTRNWNLNSNLETYFGYSTGNYRWQIGPQFRYQLLPSLTKDYPVKEYLLNYGLKVGVVKSLK